MPRTPPTPEAADRAGLEVLVAGERPVIRRGLCALLGDAGFTRVLEASSTTRVAGFIRHRRPDVVLIAVPPDGEPGREGLLRETLRAGTSIRAVAVLEVSSVMAARRAVDAGATGVVPPSVTAAALASAVHDVAAGRRHVHPELLAALVGQLQGVNDSARTLTPRERDVTALVAEGLTNASIAERLSVAESTVKTHLKHVLEKLGARDRAQAVAIAIRSGLIG